MAKVSLDLIGSDAEIERAILKQLKSEVDKRMDRVLQAIITPIRGLVQKALMQQPEVESLAGGVLAAEFGLPDGQNRIADIINFWVSNIQVRKTKTTVSDSRINGGFMIHMIRADYQDVLGLGQATLITEKGQILPWLEWLLLFGDRAIIRNYEVSMTREKKSRTGLAIMVEGGKNWSVPPQFSGVANNNFVTRAMSTIENDIERIIRRQLKAVF